jgi:hypothetical protein
MSNYTTEETLYREALEWSSLYLKLIKEQHKAREARQNEIEEQVRAFAQWLGLVSPSDFGDGLEGVSA